MKALAAMTLDERVRLQFEVEQFLYREAELLDDREFERWLELLTDDVHYWMPVRRTTTAREADGAFTQPGEMAFFDDDRAMLETRVAKLRARNSWAEDPPSRTRHFVTNVQIKDVAEDEITVACAFRLSRTRLDSEEDSWVGRREDVLRLTPAGLRLARRHIFLEQTLLLAQNLSNLF
ncbi:MAG: aromatic-ring-hydroxylating dioxygenase subunit beta [Pseudomonadota bacterium]